jgi:hypothetical protein
MRRTAAGILAGLVLALAPAGTADADEVPQRPDQIAFNLRVMPGSVLVVAETPSGEATSSPLCSAIPSLKTIWAEAMAGQDAADPNCVGVPSGSRVEVLSKTIAYAVDDPSLPAEPYGNDAHLILEVVLLSAARAPGAASERLVGRKGYMLADDLAWPAPR